MIQAIKDAWRDVRARLGDEEAQEEIINEVIAEADALAGYGQGGGFDFIDPADYH